MLDIEAKVNSTLQYDIRYPIALVMVTNIQMTCDWICYKSTFSNLSELIHLRQQLRVWFRHSPDERFDTKKGWTR